MSSILIDCEFEYGKSYEKCMCPDDCNKCVDICPGHALLDVRWDVGMVIDDIIDISYCNRIRSAFYKKLGRWGTCGLCLAVCPYGSLK